MNVRILFFGITKDLTGESNINLEVNDNCSVNDLKEILKEKFKDLNNLNSYAIAVNEEYASYDIFLKPNDVVAIIPPVSGG
ncbi:MAG: MoaD/ThiS family protein [Flavobacteriaceae bacterium]|nr:MoaD/ThiS family protein [Flavobacteriaceae bacterium]